MTTWTIRINRYQLKCLDGDVSGKQQLLDLLRHPGPSAYTMPQVMLAAGLMERITQLPEIDGRLTVDDTEMQFIRDRLAGFRFSMADPVLIDLIRDFTPEAPDAPPKG